MYTN